MKLLPVLFFAIVISVTNAFAQLKVSYSVPSSGVVVGGYPAGYFKLQENNEITLPVSVSYEVVNPGREVYRVSFEGAVWSPTWQLPDPFLESRHATGVNRISSAVRLPSKFWKKPVPVDLCLYASQQTGPSFAVASYGAEDDEVDLVPILNFTLSSLKKRTVDDVRILVKTSGGSAMVTRAYLYQGNDFIAMADVMNDEIVFEDVDWEIPARSKRDFVVKVDVRNAKSSSTVISASLQGEGVTTVNGGRAAGLVKSKDLAVRNVNVETTILGSPTTRVESIGTASEPKYRVTVTYLLKLEAVGTDAVFAPHYDYKKTFLFTLLKDGIPVR